MLPNRGLIPRAAERADTLALVALKAYSYNIPPWVDDDFRRELEKLGYELRLDTEMEGRWPDFRGVDVVLCSHDDRTLEDERRKPATKLINAWRAGAIPICGPYSAYEEIGRDGETMLVSDGTATGYIDRLRHLREHELVARRLRSSIAVEARQYDPERILVQWWEAIQSAAFTTRRQLARTLIITLAGLATRKLRRGRV